MLRLALCATLTLVLAVSQTWGQANPAPQGQKPDPNNPWSMWDIQQMIERATNEVTKRYNLKPEQTTFTRNLMATRVNAFLDKHEQKIREIFAEIFKYQLAGQDPPADKVQQWTNDINPMFDEAKVQIVEGNNEFREILSDDQKKIHDIDLKVMEQNFADAQKRLERWHEGGFDPAKDMGRPAKPATSKPDGQTPQTVTQSAPPAPVAPTTPVAPATPAASAGTGLSAAQAARSPAAAPQAAGTAPGSVAASPSAGDDELSIDSWEAYVRRFIEDYKLDSVQGNQAKGILSETRKRADEYRASRKNDYQKAQARLIVDPKSPEVQAQLKELNKPIGSLFTEMKLRLDQIPTDAQRKAYELAKGTGSKGSATSQTAAAGAAGKVAPSQAASSYPVRAMASRPTPRPIPGAVQTRPAASQPSARR